MKILFKKILIYTVFIFLSLELLVRIFHLYSDVPDWHLTEDNIYKRVPSQNGYTVYGNRRQTFSEYRINSSGYNSYHDFDPTEEGIEIAIVGDSFIEGLHQNYYNSIGRKVERKLDNIKIYEFGYPEFDMADQLHLISRKKEVFDLIDFTICEVQYPKDFLRKEYSVKDRKLVFPLLRHSKLLVYILDIGMIDPIKTLLRRNFNIGQEISVLDEENLTMDSLYIRNFQNLLNKYPINKNNFAFLIDTRSVSPLFLDFLKNENFEVIDYGPAFEKAGRRPTTLVYDRHWNNYGRTLVAKEIEKYLSLKQLNNQ